MLFIDGRKLGTLIPGSRKQKQLSDGGNRKVAASIDSSGRTACRRKCRASARWRRSTEVREHNYALTPGRYVGASR